MTTAPCPRIGIISDAADLTRFSGGSRDLAAMQLDAKITGFNAKCDFAERGKALDVSLTINIQAERGPAFQGRVAELPYLIAVVDPAGNRVMAREAYVIRANFEPNVPRTQVGTEEVSIRIPGIPPEAAQKSVLIGFQLTPDELALNRQRGPR
ncbi:hypothetical protein IAI18_14995 [Acetobacteraceae bacterium H6797]|nr:hypothetical protein [Acetobacteraceae bacterium H6797]